MAKKEAKKKTAAKAKPKATAKKAAPKKAAPKKTAPKQVEDVPVKVKKAKAPEISFERKQAMEREVRRQKVVKPGVRRPS